MKFTILFIGAINCGKSPFGGEDYKNQLMVKHLDVDYNLTVIDTINWKKNPIIIIKLLLSLLFLSFDKIVISASSASTYRVVQFLNFFPIKLSKTHYFVIGGYFPEGLRTKRYLSKYYMGLKSVVVEGEILKKQMLEVDEFQNVTVVPNFKEFDINQLKFKTLANRDKIKFVFISRISKSKGIDIIFDAAKILIVENYGGQFEIDFYGKIESGFEAEFKVGLKNTDSNYIGYLDLMNNSAEAFTILAEYDVMLFPTYWMGEGFPGVVIDAYVSGLPVIASDWNMNKELIEEEVTGLIVPIKDKIELAKAMKRFINEGNLVSLMSKNCISKASQFHIDGVWKSVRNVLN